MFQLVLKQKAILSTLRERKERESARAKKSQIFVPTHKKVVYFFYITMMMMIYFESKNRIFSFIASKLSLYTKI